MTTVVGDTHALAASLEATWLARAEGHVTASPQAHVSEMVRQALKAGVLRPVDPLRDALEPLAGFEFCGEIPTPDQMHDLMAVVTAARAVVGG